MAINKNQKNKGTKKTEAPSKALVKPPTRALSTGIKPNFREDAGQGQEEMGKDDYAIPRLVLLQDLSPYCKKKDEKYVENAEPGMIMNTVTKELWDGLEGDGVVLIPVSYRRTHLEWKPRSKGGGFVKDHGTDPSILAQTTKNEEDGKNMMKNGNIVVVTGEYFVFMVNPDGSTSPFMISMAGSQLKKSRQWNTLISQLRVPDPDKEGETFNPAMFYKSYRFTSVPENNEKGSWIGWKIDPDLDVTELTNGSEIYLAARAFREQVRAGTVKTSTPVDDGGAGGPSRESDSDTM